MNRFRSQTGIAGYASYLILPLKYLLAGVGRSCFCVSWMAQEYVITYVQLFILEIAALQPDETGGEDVYIAANLGRR